MRKVHQQHQHQVHRNSWSSGGIGFRTSTALHREEGEPEGEVEGEFVTAAFVKTTIVVREPAAGKARG